MAQRQRQYRQEQGWQQDRQHRRQALRAKSHVGVNRQRIRVISHHDRRAKLAKSAQPRQQQPRGDRRSSDRQADAKERLDRPASERGGDAFEHWIHRGKGRSRRNDQKGCGDKDFGEHDADERVGQRAAGQATKPTVIAD